MREVNGDTDAKFFYVTEIKLLLIQIKSLQTKMLTVIFKVITKKITQNNTAKETKELNWYIGKHPSRKQGIN